MQRSMYNLWNKANLVHNLFLVYLSSSTYFGDYVPIIRRKDCVYATFGTRYSMWVTGMQGGMNTRQSSTQNNKYQVSHKHSCFSWWWAHSWPKHVEIDKYTKNKLSTKLALFTRLYRNARSTKHKSMYILRRWIQESRNLYSFFIYF
jgi:hypothetical protein